jgi:ribosomal protein S18 acetylase RimI-like enzyme
MLCFAAGPCPDARSRLDVARLDITRSHPVEDRGRTLGWIQDLPWESSHLHAPCGNLWVTEDPEDTEALSRLASVLPQEGFTWVRVASEHARAREALTSAGFEPILEMVNFERELAAAPPPATGDVELIPAYPSDADLLAGMGRRLFSKDRFHSDRLVSREAANALHADWAANCARGTAADVVLLAQRGGAPAGFHAWRVLPHEDGIAGTTVLIGTLPEHSGRGIGRAMVSEGLIQMFARGARAAWVRTESTNLSACRLYASCGFAPSARFWYFRR